MTKAVIRVVAAVIEHDGRYLITQRNATAVLPLLWEFPGGRVEPGERDEDALRRELAERLGVDATVGALLLHVAHEYTPYVLDLMVYRVDLGAQDPQPLAVRDLRWVEPTQFGDYSFPGADQQTVDALLGRPPTA